MTSVTEARVTSKNANKDSETGSGNDLDESKQEKFITLPSPQPFTRAVTDSVEYRPTAVLGVCEFLNKLVAKCKEELHKLGCERNRHTYAAKKIIQTAQENTGPGKNGVKKHSHHHPHKETWDKRMQRLKVYQRVFSAIVMHFKAYCPILFYIKKTYEDMLNYRIDQIKLAHFEKRRLQILKNSMKRQIEAYRFPEVVQLKMNEQYCGILRQRINLQEEAIKVITGILRKLEEALSEHFERHRDLEEQIIMVDNEITNRRQKAFSMREKEEIESKEKKQANSEQQQDNAQSLVESDDDDLDDPFRNVDVDAIDEERRMVWIMSFAICHKDLEEAEKKINMYQTKYQFVIPRHENESMKRSIIDEKFQAKNLADEKGTLEDELGNLKEVEVKLDDELTHVKTQLTELRTTVTPRPSWEQLGEFVQGGVPKWTKMIQGKSTKDASEKLFTELKSRRGGELFLQPLGAEPTVMRCLRYGKKISDRQLHSRDAALMIHDIWLSRKNALVENLNAPPQEQNEFDFGKPIENKATKGFPDFVAIYYEDFYEDEGQRMEWTYNVVECCKRFSLDYRLTLFLDVLQQQRDEGVYFVTRNELLRVRNIFLQKSVDEGMIGGTLSSNQYLEALELIYPNKAEEEIQSIVRVTNKLNVQLNSSKDADLSVYHITQLMDMRDDGFRGALVTELVKQFEHDRQTFLDKVVVSLAMLLDISPHSARSETDPAGNKDVSVVDVYAAIQKTDDDIEDEKIGAALAWIFTQTSVMVGGGISTFRLVNYCKLHAGAQEEKSVATIVIPSQDLGSMDDDKFERAIKDIVSEEEDTQDGEPQMSDAQKKAFYKSLKTAKLKTVVKRLKGSALLSSQQMYDPEKDSPLPEEAIDLEKDLLLLKKAAAPAAAARHDIPQHMLDEMDEDEDEDEDEELGALENPGAPNVTKTTPAPTTPAAAPGSGTPG